MVDPALNDDEGVKNESEKISGPIPRHIVDMRHDMARIHELIDSIQRLSTARRKIEDSDFSELRERLVRLPLPKA